MESLGVTVNMPRGKNHLGEHGFDIRGAFVPSVTSNLFMVTFPAREVTGSYYGQDGRTVAHLVQVFYADCRGHDLHNLRKTARSPTTVTACQFAHSPSRPKAAQRTTRLSMKGQMGGSPQASATASGRGNQPAGDDPESNSGCPGFHDIREISTSAVNFG